MEIKAVGINDWLKITENNNTDSGNVSFSDFLFKAIDNIDNLQKQADYQTQLFLLGQTDNPYDMVIASEKASLALSLALQVRGKILDAYNEIMRMQV